jgi:hypothetical protein
MATRPLARSRRLLALAAFTAAALVPASVASATPNPNAPGQQKKAPVEEPADSGAISTQGLSWL